MKGQTNLTDSKEKNMNTKKPSKMAERVAFIRFSESIKPEAERICYDPYAIHFISPETPGLSRDTQKAKDEREYYEVHFPGLANSVRARVRYFDDFVKNSLNEGLEQLVILGAGYDTRAYRIEGLKSRVRVFEVDHPGTQSAKIEKVKEIFGLLPDHVTFVPVDFETENFGEKLIEHRYDQSLKTLFLMEGLIMYIPLEAVDETLAFIVQNSGKGSAILFDYNPKSSIDGTCELEAGKNLRNFAAQNGEPLKFGIKEEMLETFLTERGFSRIRNVTAETYKKMYFHGVNKDRKVYSLLSFAHAVIE